MTISTQSPIRLVASDLDGTLLIPANKNVGERALRILKRLQEHGILVILASGRPPRSMAPIVEQAGIITPAICANGGMVYDPITKSVILKRSIETHVVNTLVNLLRDHIQGVIFGCESGTRYKCESTWYELRKEFCNHEIVIEDALEFSVPGGDTVEKLNILHPTWDSEKLYHTVMKFVEGHPVKDGLHISYSNPDFIELTAAGVSKGDTLAKWCEENGVHAKEVIAFGDMPNDVEMLKFAGLRYAVKGAHPAAVAVADGIIPSVEEDGVAVVLEKLLEEGRFAKIR